jgi:hypothetical protein
VSRRDTALIVLAVVCVIVAGVLIWADKDAAAIAGAIGAAIGRLSGANANDEGTTP